MAGRRLVLGAVALPLLLLGALITVRQVARARTFQLFGRLVAEVDTRDSVVALTFDDGPAGAVADTLIEALRGELVTLRAAVRRAAARAANRETRIHLAGVDSRIGDILEPRR